MNFEEKKNRQHNKQKPPNVFHLPFCIIKLQPIIIKLPPIIIKMWVA